MAGKHRAKAPAPRSHLPRRLTPPVVAALVVAILVVIGVVVGLAANVHDSKTAATPPTTASTTPTSGSTSSAAATPTTSPSLVTTSTQPTASPSRRTTAPRPRVAVVTIRTPYDASWVTVRNHLGRALYDALLPRGRVLRYTDPVRLSVVIGNAGATDIYAGTRHIGPRRTGQVLTIVVNR